MTIDCFERQANVDKFQSIRQGFDQLGFASDELESIYSILAAVIHLGDLDIVTDEKDSERCQLTNPGQAAIGKVPMFIYICTKSKGENNVCNIQSL